jgi:hypothetical protein
MKPILLVTRFQRICPRSWSCVTFCNMSNLRVRSCNPFTKFPSWETTPCQLFATAYLQMGRCYWNGYLRNRMVRLLDWSGFDENKELVLVNTVVNFVLRKMRGTADKGWSSSLGFGRGANKSSPQKNTMLRNTIQAGCCECGNEPSSSIKCGEFLD